MFKFPIYILLAITSSTSQAFSFVNVNTNVRSTTFTLIPKPQNQLCCRQSQSNIILYSTADESSSSTGKEQQVEEVQAEITEEEPAASASTEEEEEEEEAQPPEEDPEITSLKQQIAQLESELKQKNRDLNNIERLAEDYTKGGYARKVAEMESFRRARNAASTDAVTAARAESLKPFLPIMTKLHYMGVNYEKEGNEFASNYKAISWDFKNALKDLGVTEYTTKEGEKFDGSRMVAVREEYSDNVEKGFVIAPDEIGFEIEGNVMRMATVVVSLGSEAEAVAAAAEEGGGGGGDGESGSDGESAAAAESEE